MVREKYNNPPAFSAVHLPQPVSGRYYAWVFMIHSLLQRKEPYHAVHFNPPFNPLQLRSLRPFPFFCAARFGLLSPYFANCI